MYGMTRGRLVTDVFSVPVPWLPTDKNHVFAFHTLQGYQILLRFDIFQDPLISVIFNSYCSFHPGLNSS
ncbi:unnamed protein product [Penicillium camemberti]|uniref:Str. FM013 n=1 Tax=Penicillium camemberti (strain FM 013) TaxID=1429867 RepID=A0A0G4P426_PENC3|nr:unnamed protein product [Penicillium camemberti]